VLAPARWRVEVVTRSAARGDVRVVDGRGAAAASPPAIAYPTVVVAPRWRETVAILRGVTVEVLDTRPRPSAHAPDEPALALRRDVPGRVLRIVEELLTLLAELGAPVAVDERIVVIIGPLRSDVAQAHPHAVYVSDQALDLLPTERLLRFHEVAIARALLDDLLTRALAPHLSPSARTWVPGTVAFALTEVWERRRDYRDEFAGDILRNFTFVPAIDRFLYTGQAAFGSQYFRGVEDVDPLRNHPERFHHELPRGRRIHAKLLDTLGPTRVAELYASWLRAPEQPFEAAAEAAYGHVLDWFFDQWIGPYPAVDYGIKQVASARAGAGWAHEITLEKRGLRPLVEPVQVLVKERGGREHRLVWNGELGPDAGRGAGLAAEPLAGVHVLRLQTDRPLRSVRLDPRARLQQTAFAPPNVDPRFDDRRPAAFRFLYTGAGLSIAASEIANATTASAAANAIAGFVSFEASLRRDLRRTGHFILLRNRESNLSGSAGVNFRFGAKANELRRRARVRLFGTIDWLSDRSLDTEGGVRLIQSLALIDDTRRSVWWPARGHQLWLEAAARQTLRGGEDPLSVDLLVDASYVQQVPIVHGHTLATLLDVRAVLPLRGPLEFRALQRAGGIGALSGYGADELFGRGVARVQAEYRHTFVDDLPVNALNLAWLRSLGGALFAGTASVSGCESFAGWLGPETWYGAVGYGLTANLQILGVTPQLVRVEVAVPLVRRTTQCLDRTLPDWLAQLQGLDDAAALLPPYNISLLFTQPF
jgi:acyl-coenzyme A thioesterase PaaI-like protein